MKNQTGRYVTKALIGYLTTLAVFVGLILGLGRKVGPIEFLILALLALVALAWITRRALRERKTSSESGATNG